MKVIHIRREKGNPISRSLLGASILVVGIILQAQNSKEDEPPKSASNTAPGTQKLLPPIQLDGDAAL